ncbi:Locomotion-related protein Hikaru genki [Halotydeus destructor]|nr:Locomotion-related protein Hikaru genki [Halotydeus destructor]
MLVNLFLLWSISVSSTTSSPVINSPHDSNVLPNELAANGNKATTSSSAPLDTPRPNGLTGNSCASPEVLVNGSPSPEIVDTVGGGKGTGLANILEIQFVGLVGPNDQKRICKIKCLNGVWVGPMCALEPEVECPPIDSLDPNRVMSVDGNKMHNRARFSCVEGFYLDGSDDLVCTPNGYWSYPPPKCKAIECPEVQSDDPHMMITGQNRTFGSLVYYSCPEGYKLNGSPSMTCLRNNTWSEKIPSCEAIDCEPPLPPVNGRVLDSGRFRTGDYVQYSCKTGYILVGESLSICLENGTWSKPVPSCKPSCDFPGEPVNGYVVPTKFSYNIGETISNVCKPNFKIVGSAVAHCNPDGRWSTNLPLCEAIYGDAVSCKFPNEPRNGHANPSKFEYNVGETITFRCKSKYQLHGSTMSYCKPDGSWSSLSPLCKEKGRRGKS